MYFIPISTFQNFPIYLFTFMIYYNMVTDPTIFKSFNILKISNKISILFLWHIAQTDRLSRPFSAMIFVVEPTESTHLPELNKSSRSWGQVQIKQIPSFCLWTQSAVYPETLPRVQRVLNGRKMFAACVTYSISLTHIQASLFYRWLQWSEAAVWPLDMLAALVRGENVSNSLKHFFD